ncbi:MAG TPA: helix-hairpin-helix domain-containing protein [Acidobacteriaceae bacterium]|jgi:competence protein ComEA
MGGITMHLQKRLRNILCGAGLVFALAAMPAIGAPAPAGQVAAGPSASAASKMGPMDINTASADQLRTLPGIGDTYARKIVQGRPYSSKNQLVTKGILPKNVYAKVQNMIIASHVKK